MAEIVLSVAEGNHNGEELAASVTLNFATSTASDATTEWLYWRFENVTIPALATIVSAIPGIPVLAGTTDEPSHTFSADSTANAAAVAAGAGDPISSRPKTTATVLWDSADLGVTGVTMVNGPDLKTIVQEKVNGVGWASGNAINLYLQGSADGARDLQVSGFSNGHIATFTINYTVASGGSTGKGKPGKGKPPPQQPPPPVERLLAGKAVPTWRKSRWGSRTWT